MTIRRKIWTAKNKRMNHLNSKQRDHTFLVLVKIAEKCLILSFEPF